MALYLLASHVYLCVTDDHGVLLDLKRDKYVGLGRAQMQALAAYVKGWPVIDTGERPGVSPFVEKLLASGILTTDPARGKEARPIVLPQPQATLATPDASARSDLFDTRPALRASQVLNFLRACISARLALKWRPIASVVGRARSRKARLAGFRRFDFETARQLVAAFVYLRPLLFTTKNACLADSLGLVKFLAYYGLFPTWVFGVQTGPFAAHCWVQEGDTVLNDTPDRVRRYTPILAV